MFILKRRIMHKAVEAILRYKILHILFWVVKTILLVHELHVNFPKEGIVNYIDALNITVFQMICVYTSIYVLIPRLFAKEKYTQFIIAVFTLIALCSLGNVLTQTAYLQFIFLPDRTFSGSTLFVTYLSEFVDTSIMAIVFIGIYLVYHLYIRDQKNKMLERERLETELNFLKAQINPHFLFNALNSIYVLMKEDVNLSEEILLKFSDLLRYQLYDCSTNETTIEKEIEFLKNYIALENVRNGENTKVNFNIPEKNMYVKVAPYILIPFVENAFKHISHYKDRENRIDIDIACERGSLDFSISNTFENNVQSMRNNNKGIGLRNVKRRLELLYFQKHTLQISKEKDHFTVGLTLITDEN